MKRLFVVLCLLVAANGLVAEDCGKVAVGRQSKAVSGIFESFSNASIQKSEGSKESAESVTVVRTDRSAPVELMFATCQAVGVDWADGQWWLMSLGSIGSGDGGANTPQTGVAVAEPRSIEVNHGLWVLPVDAKAAEGSWHIEVDGKSVEAEKTEAGLRVRVDADRFVMHRAEARPHSDPFGHRFSVAITGGAGLEDALAGFYWGTILPSVVERTLAAKFPYSKGYVLSTLNVKAYAGSYPAVDHEFQIKGRLAMGSEADLDVARRMIELQFQLMNDDPEKLHRAPTSVQPDGRREYHVRRDSKDGRQNAAMFPLTGNIEVMEEAWRYYSARKDAVWLRANIGNLEDAAGWTLASVDQYGRVWSDVYYEDQVIKDGRETQAQGFAAYAFGLLGKMEKALGRAGKAAYYEGVSQKIAKVLIEPLPMGYWDRANKRFVDWVDRDGKVHDHIHLVANALPVTYGYATAEQADAVKQLIDANAGQFERFPSFLSADIAGYDQSEIGSGGPYDLSAAGRYWYWDAAYRERLGQSGLLLDQLKAVAAEGAKDNWFMGERYDMDYVYYIDGKNAHGAEKYYEYPNVYAAVLISKVLGLTVPADADVSIAPHLKTFGSVEFDEPMYALRYGYDAGGFVVKNLSAKRRRFVVDLAGLGDGAGRYRLKGKAGERFTVDLAAGEEARWTAVGREK